MPSLCLLLSPKAKIIAAVRIWLTIAYHSRSVGQNISKPSCFICRTVMLLRPGLNPRGTSCHFLSFHVHADHAVAVCCFTCPWGFGFGCGWQFCPDSKSGFVGMNVMNVPCGFHRTSSKCVTLCFSMHTPQLGTSASHISFTNALLPAALKPRFFLISLLHSFLILVFSIKSARSLPTLAVTHFTEVI